MTVMRKVTLLTAATTEWQRHIHEWHPFSIYAPVVVVGISLTTVVASTILA